MPVLKKKIRGLLLIALLQGCSHILSAQAPFASEYEVKAVFIFNFTQFVEWPSSSFSSAQAPLVIGVLGDNPFGSYLEDAVAGEKAHGHPIVVYYYKNPDEVEACNVLFINQSKSNEMSNIMAKLSGKGVLTISDANGFLQQGGIVRFFTKNNKISLQVNLDAAKSANLDISSKLLRICEIYAPY